MDAGIGKGSEAFEKLDKTRCGVLIGSGMGGLTVFQDGVKNLVEKGYKKITPFFIPYAITNMCASLSCPCSLHLCKPLSSPCPCYSSWSLPAHTHFFTSVFTAGKDNHLSSHWLVLQGWCSGGHRHRLHGPQLLHLDSLCHGQLCLRCGSEPHPQGRG